MLFDDFYEAYRQHDTDTPRKIPRRYDGYELRYPNGDVYIFDVQLIPGRRPDWNGNYSADDFIYTSVWNGETIRREATA